MNSEVFLNALWSTFSLSSVVWLCLLGSLGGLVLGLVGTAWAHRRGWMRRRDRWHHMGLKLQFLVVPACTLTLGLLAGLVLGMQREADRQIDRAQPQLHALSSAYVADFTRYVATVKELPGSPQTSEELVAALVNGYLAQTLATTGAAQDAGWAQRLGGRLLRSFQAQVIGYVAKDMVARNIVKKTGLSKGVAGELMRLPFSDFLKPDFLASLLKKQVASLARGWLLSLAILALALIGLLGLEVLVSRWAGWHRPRETPSATGFVARAP
jgi:hypothetical protein